MNYEKATETTLAMVREAITLWHPHLESANIAVIMREKASKTHGKMILGSATTPPASLIEILDDEYHFVIILAKDQWELATSKQQMAIIDHELCHCRWGEKGPELAGHDYEEFAAVIKRHGLWRRDMAEHAIQMAFDSLKSGKVATVKEA